MKNTINKIQLIVGIISLIVFLSLIITISIYFSNKNSENINNIQTIEVSSDETISDVFENSDNGANSSADNASLEEPTSTIVSKAPSQNSQSQQSQQSQQPQETPATNPNAPTKNHDNSYYAAYVQKDTSNWALKLMNLSNIDTSYSFTTASISSGQQFDQRAVQNAKDMIKACNNEGINLWPQSCYRSISNQEKIHQNYISQEINAGYSKDEAIARVRKYSMPGGASDHNLGLAIDFNTITMSFQNTAGYRWLIKNAESYGFVLRYPADKTDITLVQFEPWHFRYVGVEHAKVMNSYNMCLEEYIAYLEGNY